MSLDKETIKQVVTGYAKYHGNTTKTASQLYVSSATVRKYWTLQGLPIKHKRKKLSKSEVDKLTAAYTEYAGIARIAARETGYSIFSVLKYWRINGFQIRCIGGKVRNLEERLNIKTTRPK